MTSHSSLVQGGCQIAQFEFDQAGRPYYLIAVRDVTVDGEVTITLRGDMRVIDQIFGDRYGLGQSGENVSDRHVQIEELYHAAREDRTALDKADPELRQEVESLLAQEKGAGFLESPVLNQPEGRICRHPFRIAHVLITC